ncbi:hypothetical protein E2C01_056872 [Portunus trituberculatus]|uniref:Uncharacterized protein n=1 Tax=Portunus trituberculatus TaxID=210409 RepID=A0A5B7GVB7_PORTR|nr:hypothetical protein [Portunus trituberculatus]
MLGKFTTEGNEERHKHVDGHQEAEAEALIAAPTHTLRSKSLVFPASRHSLGFFALHESCVITERGVPG